ncbi:RING finger protein [Ceratobasidium theobromae]|uniref:RING finger protein n=1 Tax=Ceratobasidium theobromae TaxID=1582974 RepID=A0A5N5QHU7_9AGAM|nr:RING finger protein [Ceratobasidium theobromae]
MKYGKTYSTLLSTPTWPQEWRDLALDYRGLKKLLNGVVEELSAQGLNHEVLLELLDAEKEFEEHEALADVCIAGTNIPDPLFFRSRAQYEFTHSKDITPQLRIWLYSSSDTLPLTHANDYLPLPLLRSRIDSADAISHSSTQSSSFIHSERSGSTDNGRRERELGGSNTIGPVLMSSSVEIVRRPNPLYVLKSGYESGPRIESASALELVGEEDTNDQSTTQPPPNISPIQPTQTLQPCCLIRAQDDNSTREVVIPLTADTAFHRLLASALSALASLQGRNQTHVSDQIANLADTISSCSGPPSRSRQSDLYAWREIFQLWVECQIYRGGATERERASGEGGVRSVPEAEKRLGMFASEVVKRGLGDRRTLKSAKSREALETFLNLNVHILDLKKFELANAEAARKILKKHEKRTALPSSASLSVLPISQGVGDLSQILIVTLTKTLLPVLPSLDDYSCLICTGIAFKPIRLSCRHLFCVRCLVKMQKRGQAECPLCRTPCVLDADGSNLDTALMHFMQDWFPKETKEKAKSNERESAEEQLAEMGINPDAPCVIA